jgi:hypothetical protein
MVTDRQVVDEIRDAPEFVTYVEFKQQEQRLLANAAASEERLNGRFQQTFTELITTLSSAIITQLAAVKQVITQLASPVGVDTPKGGITEHDARNAQVPTERPSITVRPMALAPGTTVTPTMLPDEDLLALASRCLVLMYNVAICHPST